MKKIQLNSFAKINLSLDVLGVLDNGFHLVDMVMQQILLCDDILIKWKDEPQDQSIQINVSTNRYFLPTDERNLAYKAVLLMADKYGDNRSGKVTIDIRKRIPVAAGLAGGSGNAAAVLHGLNILWGLELSMKELIETGEQLGSDVPFCVMGQAAADNTLKPRFLGDPLACHCALATGTGTTLKPLKKGLRSHLVLSKPPLSVSTATVYKGIDSMIIDRHPDNNVLENFTLTQYPIVKQTKMKLESLCGADNVLMSGSGPAVFGLCENIRRSRQICDDMLKLNRESFWTRTTW